MQDWCLLTMPRSVAITNPRLNGLFYILFLSMLGVCLRNFIEAKQWSAKIQVHTRTLIEFAAENGASTNMLNITGHRMCPPSKNVEAAETLLSAWSNLSFSDRLQHAEALWAPVHWLQGSPPLLEASSTCLPMCSGKADPTRCLSPLTFMDQRHGSHLAVWSAKHVLRSDGPFVHSYVGLSVVSTSLVISYSYELEEAVPSLSQFVWKPAPSGDHTTARTVLINSKGVPGKRFPFGSEVKLTLKELLTVAQDLPQQLLEGTEPAWEVFRDGLELNVEVQCYNDDVELSSRAEVDQSGNNADWNLGATSKSPVCLLQVKFVRCCSTFAAPEVTTQGNVVMNRALMVQSSPGTTVMWFPSLSRLLLSWASILVLLQVPLKVVRWFTLTCLGQLSRLYKRVIVQHFDIQQAAASMAVNLMSNSVSFLELSDCATGKHHFPAISRARMEERLRAALQQRRHVLSDSELSAFVSCCFHSMLTGGGDRLDLGKELNTAGLHIPATPSSFQSGDVEREVEDDIIDIDTFNVHCSTGHAVDLQAAVELFDQDRYRWPLEWLFTPRRLQQALRKVKQASKSDRQETSEHINVFDDIDVQHHASVFDLEEHGISILTPSSGQCLNSARLSLEEKKTVHEDQQNSFQLLRTIVRDLMQRERDHEQAMKLQANKIEKLRECTSNLEAELHKAEVALESMTKTIQKGEQKQSWVHKIEKNLMERISELERSVDDRLSRALSNNGLLSREATDQSNLGVDSHTLSEQAIQLGELTDRLAMLEVELKHNSLAAKESCQLLAEELQNAKRRLATLEEDTVRMKAIAEPHRSGQAKHGSQERSTSRGQQVGAFEEMNGFTFIPKASPSTPRLMVANATTSHFAQIHQSQGSHRDCVHAFSAQGSHRDCVQAISARTNSRDCFGTDQS